MPVTFKTPKSLRPRHPLTPYLVVALVFVVVITYFYPRPSVSHYKYEQGRPWNYAQLIAPFDVPIHPDSASMRAALDSLNNVFIPVYERVPFDVDSVFGVAVRRMEAFKAQSGDGVPVADNPAPFYAAIGRLLTSAYHRGVLVDSLPETLGASHRARGRMRHGNVLEAVSLKGMVTRSSLLEQIDSLGRVYHTGRRLQNAGFGSMLRPTVVCDVEESERIMANEKAIVTIDRGVIQRGQSIIDKGALITPQDYTNIRTYEEMLEEQLHESSRNDVLLTLGRAIYVLLIVTAFMFYLYIFERQRVWDNLRAVVFLFTLITFFFLLVTLLSSVWPAGVYVVPLAIVPVLALVFFDGRLALMTAMVCILLCVATSVYPLEFLLLNFVGATAAVYSLRDVSQRRHLLRASGYVCAGYLVAYLAMQIMMNGSFDDFSWRIVGLLVINSLLTSLAYVLMFAVEKVFGFVSDVTLVELTDSNAPLLRELSDVCPGTFQHCVAVSTLATDAARACGANVLLVRAGAMYHDIGKMSNPAFFTENQRGVNPHDGLSPERSARIIVSHVTEGLKIAEKAGLPMMIREFIREHHGRGRAKYFYIMACKQAPEGETPDPTQYTYPGPNPRSVETSILMMADSVEAASRSMKEHTPQAITELVDKIIDGQIKDGLHNDSQLSFRDVGLIKKAFVKRLSTIYHSRIEYPDAPKAAE